MMRLAKPLFLAVLGFAVAAYASDCGAMTTPEDAMQCCSSMACSSHGLDDQDCCATMPAMHPLFVQPSAGHGISVASAVFAVLPASNESMGGDSSTGFIATHSHGPPIFHSPASRPLRI
jgi:hypothetical protein